MNKTTEISLILKNDGSMMVPRGSRDQNDILLNVLNNVIETEQLSAFFSLSEKSEKIFGDEEQLCG